jgi:hypothetical protein
MLRSVVEALDGGLPYTVARRLIDAIDRDIDGRSTVWAQDV